MILRMIALKSLIAAFLAGASFSAYAHTLGSGASQGPSDHQHYHCHQAKNCHSHSHDAAHH